MSKLKWLIVGISLLTTVLGIVIAYTWFADLYGGDVYAAVKANDLSAVKTLLSLGRDVNMKDSYTGITPLYAAVRFGRVKMASYLISQGADVNIVNNVGVTPLYEAVSAGVYLTLQGGNIPTDLDEIRLNPPTEDDYVKMVSLLLVHGARSNVKVHKGNTPLHYAYNANMIQALLSHGALINAQNNDGETPLFTQSKPRLFGQQFSVRYDNIIFLLSKGADINAYNRYGNTLLHVAAVRGDTNLVRLLISKGANVNLKNHLGETPLLCAQKWHHADIVNILRQYSVKANTN